MARQHHFQAPRLHGQGLSFAVPLVDEIRAHDEGQALA
jgi:hypothetical protein